MSSVWHLASFKPLPLTWVVMNSPRLWLDSKRRISRVLSSPLSLCSLLLCTCTHRLCTSPSRSQARGSYQVFTQLTIKRHFRPLIRAHENDKAGQFCAKDPELLKHVFISPNIAPKHRQMPFSHNISITKCIIPLHSLWTVFVINVVQVQFVPNKVFFT